ncbi:Septum formation initiator [Alkalithermobacter thermoalcaliphilus JW-YL-7 = DSM 7308]|uniref:Cell division protein FtsL family protein n=1 Tax=Alkalithermobacter thermoalcaliphilus JW-YL-7 = DSM 7308 TaxID=1121328 RepID=A0A150FPK0_CLOPD|nr:cell division protein FtsL family protein [[Clostridium] paradoxum JW-YL-7 = DSM 7308]SHK98750.1 Septum formation initiator [[Clostridium] paradoxum JW-YL-7 = DSM 7308]
MYKNVTSLEEYKNRKKNTIYREKRAKKRKFKPIIKLAFFMIFGVMIAFMCGYAYISSLKYEIHSLNRELRGLENKKGELTVELERLSKSGYIEREAKKRLNMVYPSEEQIVYIRVD